MVVFIFETIGLVYPPIIVMSYGWTGLPRPIFSFLEHIRQGIITLESSPYM